MFLGNLNLASSASIASDTQKKLVQARSATIARDEQSEARETTHVAQVFYEP